MSGITTIEELELAKQENPGLVRDIFERVGVHQDLLKYLEWLSDSEGVTKLNFKLSRGKKRPKGIHPSSACKRDVCLLKLYYECTFEVAPEPNVEEATRLTWDIGTFLHELHQAYFNDMYGDQFSEEVGLGNAEYLIKSRTDGLFDFSDHRVILEMKSIKEGGNFGFSKVQDAPFDSNVRQAHFYMWLSNVPFAIIFYICKNTSEYKEHRIMFDPDMWMEIENNVILPTIRAVKTKKPPDGDPGWHCRWCDFGYACPAKNTRGKNGAKSAKRTRSWTSR